MISNHTLSDKFAFMLMTIISIFSFYSGYRVFSNGTSAYHHIRSINENGADIMIDEISFPEFIINVNRNVSSMTD